MSPRSLVPEAQLVRGEVISREAAVICGAAWVEETFRQLDPRVVLHWRVKTVQRSRSR